MYFCTESCHVHALRHKWQVGFGFFSCDIRSSSDRSTNRIRFSSSAVASTPSGVTNKSIYSKMSSLLNLLTNASCNSASDFTILKNAKEFNRVIFADNASPIVISTFQQLMTSDMQGVHWVFCDILAKEYDVQVRYCTMRTRNRSEKMNCFRSGVMIGISCPFEDERAREAGYKPKIYSIKIFGSGKMQIFGIPADAQEAMNSLQTVELLLKRLNEKISFTLDLSLSFEQRNIGLRVQIPMTTESSYIRNGILDIMELNSALHDKLDSEPHRWSTVKTWSSPERDTVIQYCQAHSAKQPRLKFHLSMYCSGTVLVFGPSLHLHYEALKLLDTVLSLSCSSSPK